ncbi:MAG: hypothetical protein M9951_10305 [Burkholderiaceae bacterium]|nr:hypothetical protein [Burkholderiaceae bacterium]
MGVDPVTRSSAPAPGRRVAPPPAWIAPLLLGGALLAFVLVVAPARSTLASLDQARQAVEVHASTDHGPVAPMIAEGDPYRLQVFRNYLSPGDLESDWVVMIHAMADQLGLSLDEIRYHHAPSTLEGFREARLQTTLRGPYETIQTYVEALLGRIPVLAIDRLVLSTTGATPGHVEASLEMTLFVGERR